MKIELLLLISNLTEAGILISASIILLLVKPYQAANGEYYRRAKLWLSLCVAMIGLSFLSEQLVNGVGARVEALDMYNLLFFFVISISGLLALTHLYNSKRLSKRFLALVFAPVVLLIGIYVILSALLEPGPVVYTLDELLRQLPESPLLVLRLLILLAILAGIGVSMFCYIKTSWSYRAMLDDYFSDDQLLLRSRWIDRFFYCSIVLVCSTVISYVISSIWYDLFFTLILTCSVLFLVGRFLRYQNLFLGVAPAVEYAQIPAPERAAVSPLDDPVAARLVRLWTERPDKPYLKMGVTLGDVSRMTGLGRHRLSAYLNAALGQNFNGWIAQLRIQQVKALLEDCTGTNSLSEIAAEVGFSDLTAMSNAFKKATGVSPSAYKKQQST